MTFKEMFDNAVKVCENDQFMNTNDAKENFVLELYKLFKLNIDESKIEKGYVVSPVGKSNIYKIFAINMFNEPHYILEFKINCKKTAIKKNRFRYKASGYNSILFTESDESASKELFESDIVEYLNKINL